MKAICKCNKCGASQEQQFSWDGKCLMCEEGDEDYVLQDMTDDPDGELESWW